VDSKIYSSPGLVVFVSTGKKDDGGESMRLYYDEKHSAVRIELHKTPERPFYTCSDFATTTVSLRELMEAVDKSGVLDAWASAKPGGFEQQVFDFEGICTAAGAEL